MSQKKGTPKILPSSVCGQMPLPPRGGVYFPPLESELVQKLALTRRERQKCHCRSRPGPYESGQLLFVLRIQPPFKEALAEL